jgi:hypothetical protein
MIYQLISTLSTIVGNYFPSLGKLILQTDGGFRAPISTSSSGVSFITDQLYDLMMKTALTVADSLVVAIVIPFLGLFIVLELFWDIIRQRIKDDGAQNFTLRQPILLILLILVCTNYVDLATNIDKISNSVVNDMSYIVMGGKDNVKASQQETVKVMSRISSFDDLSPTEKARPLDETNQMYAEKYALAAKVKDGKGTEEETAKVAQGAISTGEWAANGVSHQVESVLYQIVFFCAKIIRAAIEGIAFVLTMLLIGVGPLAILSYAIPGDIGKAAITQTLGTFFQYKLWLILIGVIDILLVSVYKAFYVQRIANSAVPGNWNVGDNFMGIIMILTFLAMYIAVPKLTTVIMQRGDAAGLKSSAVSAVKSGVNVVKNISTGNWKGLVSQSGGGGKK